MKPLGYFRALEKLLTLMRDHKDALEIAGMTKEIEAELNSAADAVDQAWMDLNKEDQLMVYNMAKHLTDNIRPKEKAPEEAPRIQLLN